MWANRAGLWKITQDLRIVPIGRRLDRVWKNTVSPSIEAEDIPAGHNYRLDSKYRLITNGDIGAGYNYAREYLADGYRDGSWMTISGYETLGFANSQSGAFAASTKGRVLQLYTNQFEDPFWACGEGISSEALLASMDFGDSGRRKSVTGLLLQLRTDSDISGLEVSSTTDTISSYLPMDSFSYTQTPVTGLEDVAGPRIMSFKFTPQVMNGIYFQPRITHSTGGEKVNILSVSYRVRGLSEKGIPNAAESK